MTFLQNPEFTAGSAGLAASHRSRTAYGIKAKRHAPAWSTFNAFAGDLVVDASDAPLGSISDLWIDMASGRIVHAIVSSGGFMGRGERLHPVPWAALQHSAERRVFMLCRDRPFFLGGPVVERSHLGTPGASPEIRQALADYYGMGAEANPSA